MTAKQGGLIQLGMLGILVYGVATLIATITHEPDPTADFRAWAQYVTTTEFLLTHLFGSIVGMGIGLLGVIALYAVLAGSGGSRRVAASGLIASVAGMVLVLPLFGAAAFGQPAIGRAYLDGVEAAVAIREDMYGVPLILMGVSGTLWYSAGSILLGVAIWRSHWLPRAAGVLYAIGVPLIAFFGLMIGEAQTLGSLMLIVSGGWLWFASRSTKPAELAPVTRPPEIDPGAV